MSASQSFLVQKDRQFLIDELERLAGVGVFGATKTAEMELCRKEGGVKMRPRSAVSLSVLAPRNLWSR